MHYLLKIYISLLCFSATALSIYWFVGSTIDMRVLPYFVALIILAEAYKVQLFLYDTKERVSLSWSLVVTISVLVGSGIGEAIIVNLIGGIVCSIYPKRLPIIKIIYNISSYLLTVTLTYTIFRFLVQYDLFFSSGKLFELIYIPIIYLSINFSIGTLLMKILTMKRMKSILADIIGSYYHYYLIFSFIGGIQGYFYKVYGMSSLILTSILIGVVLHSFKKTADIANARIVELDESNRKSNKLAKELDQTLEQFIHTLTATIDARDPYTYGHSLQVSNYAWAIATELKLSEQEIETVRIAGLLHDIGKISIPESILFKEGRLTEEEYSIMKTHASIGEEILSDIPRLDTVSILVGMHHERYDGSGYPRNLLKDEIPIGAHILGVSDTLDAIISNRSYKDERSVDDALKEIKRCYGTFHPDVINALINLHNKLGDEPFINSAQLVEHSMFEGKLKNSRDFFNKVYNKGYQIPLVVNTQVK